jgi:threonine dehydratase
MALPTLDELRDAAARLQGRILPTPLLPLDGDAAWAKPENLQRTNSFKIRGASHFLARIDPAILARGVVTHSSGNHAQGVACAAADYGVPATIVIPDGAPEVKVRRTLAFGAQVVRCANDKASREGTAERIAAETGATLVPPYDHPWIVAGQASVGLEIIRDMPDVANVLVCVGGGGLLAGVAAALRAAGSKAQIMGVEPELAADATESFARGEIVTWPSDAVARTIADGVRTQALGVAPFEIIRRSVDGFVTVSEDEIRSAAAWYLNERRLVVEPTGALTLAAYRRLRETGGLRSGPTIAIVSGGNIEPSLLAALVGAA